MSGCDPLTNCGHGGPCEPVEPRPPRCDNVLPDGVFTNATVYVSGGCISGVSTGVPHQYTPEPCCDSGGGEGEPGPPGEQGPPGDAATVTIGSTTTLSPGQPATVTNSGSSTHLILNFGIPAGADGGSGGGGGGLTIDDGGIEFEDGILKSVVNWPPLLGVQTIVSPVDVIFTFPNPNQVTGESIITLDLTAFRQNIVDDYENQIDGLQNQIDALQQTLTTLQQTVNNCCP